MAFISSEGYTELYEWLARTPLYRLVWVVLLAVQALQASFQRGGRDDPLGDVFWRERVSILESELEDKTHRVCVSKWYAPVKKSLLANFLPVLPMKQNVENLFQTSVRFRPKQHDLLKHTDSSLVVIVGPPRVGSTFLHTLLSLDSRSRTMKAWELRHPFAVSVDTSTKLKRMALCEKELSTLYSMAPRMTAIHHVTHDGPDECVVGMHTSPLIDVCAWGCLELKEAYEFWKCSDSDAVYDRYFELLSVLVCEGSDDEFSQLVLKSPHHSLKLNGMLKRSKFKRFESKKLLWLHRNPLDVVCSTCEMNCAMLDYSSAYFFDRKALGERTLSRLVSVVQQLVKDDSSNEYNVVHVSYSKLVSNPLEVVEEIYLKSNLQSGEGFFERTLPEYLRVSKEKRAKLKSRRSSAPSVDILAKYGLSEADVNSKFAQYISKYSMYF